MNHLESKRSRDPRSSVVLNRSQNVEEKPSGGEKASSRKRDSEIFRDGVSGLARSLIRKTQSSSSRIRSSLRLNLDPSDTIAPRSSR